MENNEIHGVSGKVALVTGGTTGIGRATAELLHQRGARVIITGQNADTLATARRELPSEIAVVQADARSVADAERLASEVKQRFSKLDIVFLNAGIAQLAPFDAVTESFYEEHMNVNVKGVVFTLQKLLPLLGSGASVIVNTSVADQRGAPMMSIYSATKGAVAALVRCLAVELAPRGIRVNSVSPATILTPIQAKFGLPPDVAAASAKHYSERIPQKRFGNAEEVASAVVFLASPAASYITGVELPVDGGLTIS
ncbi:MAG TPA: SDR family oxidoreductase [Polyangiaceae bacterium]|nr:SDR family oxidoreductase [Polyangiaceae bacterium]